MIELQNNKCLQKYNHDGKYNRDQYIRPINYNNSRTNNVLLNDPAIFDC